MTTSEPGVELFDALRMLRVAVSEFSQDVAQPLARHEAPLGRLEDVIHSLGQTRPAQPPPRHEEYVQQWTELLGGKRQRLERRATRYLCWEPDVATDNRFQEYLDREHADLGPRWLQGLVRSSHARWSPEFVTGPVVERVRHRLESYQGSNQLLLRWKSAPTMILGPRGPGEFAAYMVENLQAIKACCEDLGVDEQTRYVLEAVRQAVRQCREGMGRSRTFGQYLREQLLPWANWPLQDFKAEVGATIIHPAVSEIRESLTSFILHDNRLGDPRLPRNVRNWIGVPEEVRLRFIQWLSRADIVFFFEHVLPRGEDPHGRKAFWLRYVPRMLMSRPLLNQDDTAHLRTTMRQMGEQILHFGRMRGTTSAFLLDFGPILVIEFSRVGNACYVYQKGVLDQVVPDFWTLQPFSDSQLKQRHLPRKRVPHQRGWQAEMSGILATHGIRPS